MMKKFGSTIALIVLLAALVTIVLVLEKGPKKDPEADKTPPKIKVTDFASKEFTRVEIRKQYDIIEMDKGRNGKWRITAPVKARTGAFAVDSLVQTLAGLEADARTDENSATLSDFGLDNPQSVVTAIRAGGKREVFSLGSKTPIGESYYLKHNGTKGVLIINSGLAELFLKTVDELRDKSIVAAFDRIDVKSIGVTAGDRKSVCEKYFTKGKKPDEKWMLNGDKSRDCYTEAMGLLGEIEYTDAADFVDEPSDISTLGLDKPRYEISIVFSGGRKTRLATGTVDAEGNLYVRNIERNEIYLVPATVNDATAALFKLAVKLK